MHTNFYQFKTVEDAYHPHWGDEVSDEFIEAFGYEYDKEEENGTSEV